jgi:hypothetical protein
MFESTTDRIANLTSVNTTKGHLRGTPKAFTVARKTARNRAMIWDFMVSRWSVRMTIVTIVVEILYGDSKIIVLFHTWILTYQYQVVLTHPGAHVCRYLCQYSSTRIVEHVRARLRYHPLRIRGCEIRLMLYYFLLLAENSKYWSTCDLCCSTYADSGTTSSTLLSSKTTSSSSK